MQVVASKADGAEGGNMETSHPPTAAARGGTASPARADGTAPPTPLIRDLPAEPRQAVWPGRTCIGLTRRLQPGFIGALRTE
jgi:hypothetical protein